MERDVALKKILHYCDYQDRCKKEIFTKLDSFELSDSDKDFIIDFLCDDGYINDERYCRSYVKSKLNLKKWGVNKIKLSLLAKGIDREIIDNIISEIDVFSNFLLLCVSSFLFVCFIECHVLGRILEVLYFITFLLRMLCLIG